MLSRIAYGVSILGTAATVVLRFIGADDTLTFGISALTILGLAYTLGHATEQLGLAAGPRIGGIMNATVGNVGEIIIASFLILDDKIEIVHASITGSIVGNLLLVLGASLLAGGLRNGIQHYDAQTTGMNAASLILATIGLIVPATFAFLVGGSEGTGPGDPQFFQIEALTVGVAILLLVTYGAQVWFFLTSPESPTSGHVPEEAPSWGWRRSLAVLLASAAALTFASEVLVHTLEPAVASLGISEFFIGIILIPLIGNLAEHVVGITLAYKNKMDFSLITSLGSATQIALFAVPVLVFFGLIVGNPVTLVFSPLEVVAVATGVIIASYIALDGKSNWVEGLQLCSVYLILAVAFFFLTP
ncbi:MAG TPA: calcium/proton exchanger [candidate division Zixibacteria bacterium]|nr:calcium/proton exchanger [candidate division Zixibacteria bacterium]